MNYICLGIWWTKPQVVCFYKVRFLPSIEESVDHKRRRKISFQLDNRLRTPNVLKQIFFMMLFAGAIMFATNLLSREMSWKCRYMSNKKNRIPHLEKQFNHFLFSSFSSLKNKPNKTTYITEGCR